jgi:PAS domain S-box-containing protein
MEGCSFYLKPETTFVGRGPGNDIQIEDRSISRRHLKISTRDDKFLIEDLESYNGTWIGKTRIGPGEAFEVGDGRLISIGNILAILAKQYTEDGMDMLYSLDVASLPSEGGVKFLYKDKRITGRQQLELIHDVSTTLMESLDINEICEKIMDSILAYLKRIDSGTILMIDNKTGELKEIIAKTGKRKKGTTHNYSRTIVNRVMLEGKGIIMSDISREAEENLSDSIKMMDIKSVMCVPLISKSKTLGAIYVHSVDLPHRFRQDDLFLLTGLSGPAALAIENAMIYDERRQAEEGLQRARDELEMRVKERTIELSRTNSLLKQEISERLRAEEHLREINNFLRNILDSSSSISILSMDLEQNILFWNKGAENLFGYMADEIVGKQKVDILYADDETKRIGEEVRLSIIKNKKEINREMRHVTKDGHELWINLNLTPRFDEKGNITGILGIGKDITERKQLEKGLIQAQKMESIGTLAGGIAHDFNNLLMGIQGHTSLMLIDTDNSHLNFEHLKGIEEYVKRASDLTKQLLGFARGGKYDIKPTNLNVLTENSSQMFGRTHKEINIYTKYQEDIWTVAVDQSQIEQVLLNLYINAWQSMPGGGDLYLKTENITLDENYVKLLTIEPGRYVKISVTDTGVGMAEKTQQRIFDPFFTTKEMGRGTGLGLASAYGIIKNHNGIINVYSRKGQGTTFGIYLPVTEKKPTEDIDLDKEVLKGSETILLVDDEAIIIDVSKRMLEKLGYRIVIARSGSEAIEIYQNNRTKIDIVILDMIMPGTSGSEAYDKLKEIDPAIKVLLSSGYSINGKAREILDRGCNGFIQKPFNLKQLSQKIREILDMV